MIDFQTTHDKVGSPDENSREHEFKVPNRLLSEIKVVLNRMQLTSEPEQIVSNDYRAHSNPPSLSHAIEGGDKFRYMQELPKDILFYPN